MAAKQAKSVASLKPFDFEGDINDSDYVLVKRVEVITDPRNIWLDMKNQPELMVEEQNIKLLSNAEFLLQIQFRQLNMGNWDGQGVLEFNLNNMTKSMDFNNELHFEISINVEFEDDSEDDPDPNLQDFDVNLTQNLGTTFMSKPFAVGNCFKCNFKLVFKLPHDSMDTTMSKLFTEAGEFCSDIKIICDNQTFQCHKIILAMKSDVFKVECVHLSKNNFSINSIIFDNFFD
jgi:hypothetical protein